jgi:hypothetical protein
METSETVELGPQRTTINPHNVCKKDMEMLIFGRGKIVYQSTLPTIRFFFIKNLLSRPFSARSDGIFIHKDNSQKQLCKSAIKNKI